MAPGFCSNCGRPIGPEVRFCPQCGSPILASGSVPVQPPVRPGMSRGKATALVILSALVIAYSMYIVVVDRDLTAVLVGIFIVVILWIFVAVVLPRANRLPLV